tara:strand:- start:199 stop:498 length:300 start_codon:yes stop_codon:yes gene_type:complete
MSEIEMFHVGENSEGQELYNLRYVKGGRSLPTPSMTKAEALAKINGTEVVEAVVVTEDKNYHDMTKKELELFMREHDIELDRRKSKEDLLDEVDKFFEV